MAVAISGRIGQYGQGTHWASRLCFSLWKRKWKSL